MRPALLEEEAVGEVRRVEVKSLVLRSTFCDRRQVESGR